MGLTHDMSDSCTWVGFSLISRIRVDVVDSFWNFWFALISLILELMLIKDKYKYIAWVLLWQNNKLYKERLHKYCIKKMVSGVIKEAVARRGQTQ